MIRLASHGTSTSRSVHGEDKIALSFGSCKTSFGRRTKPNQCHESSLFSGAPCVDAIELLLNPLGGERPFGLLQVDQVHSLL